MTTAIIAVLGVVMVAAAILALLHKSLVTAILSAGAVILVLWHDWVARGLDWYLELFKPR